MSMQDIQNAAARMIFSAAMFLLVILAGGCTYSVEITHPPYGFKDPVKTFTVKFHPDFKPGTFEAKLSGQNITNLFQPPPVPGGVSTASFTYPPNFMDYQFNHDLQELVVFGEFTTPPGLGNRVTTHRVEFSPPIVAVYNDRTGTDKELKVKEGDTMTAYAFVEKAPKEALIVRIDGNDHVSLNNQPAGASIQVTIPTNDRRAAFTVRGIQAGGGLFLFRAHADGYASDVSGYEVLSR